MLLRPFRQLWQLYKEFNSFGKAELAALHKKQEEQLAEIDRIKKMTEELDRDFNEKKLEALKSAMSTVKAFEADVRVHKDAQEKSMLDALDKLFPEMPPSKDKK
mmetsp:Transcript_34425/g.53723  ORF Transcript_34425/g.53723 Transcript_34425/m.53723 type:complete len:104 (-) Transcript_34425:2351-2662(-)